MGLNEWLVIHQNFPTKFHQKFYSSQSMINPFVSFASCGVAFECIEILQFVTRCLA